MDQGKVDCMLATGVTESFVVKRQVHLLFSFHLTIMRPKIVEYGTSARVRSEASNLRL